MSRNLQVMQLAVDALHHGIDGHVGAQMQDAQAFVLEQPIPLNCGGDVIAGTINLDNEASVRAENVDDIAPCPLTELEVNAQMLVSQSLLEGGLSGRLVLSRLS